VQQGDLLIEPPASVARVSELEIWAKMTSARLRSKEKDKRPIFMPDDDHLGKLGYNHQARRGDLG
jgi:hypothetical protein